MSLEDFEFGTICKETEQLFATGRQHSNMQAFPIERQLEEALNMILSYFFGKYKLDIQSAFFREYSLNIRLTQNELFSMGLVPVSVWRNIEALNKILEDNKKLAYISLSIVEHSEEDLDKWDLVVYVTAEEECLYELGVSK
jgi:hypothetical protein